MPDIEEQLRRYAAAAQRSVPPAAPGAMATRPARRTRWLALAAAAAVVGAVLVVTLDEDQRAEVSTDPSLPNRPSSSTTTVDTEGSTATTAPATSTMRTFPVVATTGCNNAAICGEADQYLVWSGEAGSEAAVRADGFMVDLDTGEVRPIPAAPIEPRSGATGVWTGEELIVCCGTGQLDGYGADTRSAAAWDPATDEWRVLADPPEAVARSYPASVWTGEVMVVVATGGGAATYDPATDAWQAMEGPVRGRSPQAAWTGEQVVVWDSVYGDGVYPETDDEADRGWAWTPGGEGWERLPSLPPDHRTQLGSMAWTGSEVVVWGQSTSDETSGVGARWRPGDQAWRPLASWPHDPVEDPYNGTPGSQELAATGDGRVLIVGLDGSAALHTDLYDPRSDTWTDLSFTIDGHLDVTVAGDFVLIPNEARPIAGRLSG